MFAPACRLALSLCAALLLASCGGGTSQIEPFKPTRYIAFGDELSAFTADGRKYAVNSLNVAGTAVDCILYPLWIQIVAGAYGFGFTECPVGTGTQQALTRAQPGATALGLKLQVDAQVAAGGFTPFDLVTVLVGVNDIKDIYALYPGVPEATLTELAKASGVAIAEQVNRIVALGGKVVVSTAPDVGLSPFGRAQKALFTDTDRAALLSRLSLAQNGRIRSKILNDGRFVGLVLADELVQAAVRSPVSYGFADATTAACTAALPNCDNTTLVTGATALTWLWADDLFLAAGAHARLGSLAGERARENPF